MARRSGLGRGLDSLIPGSSEPAPSSTAVGPGLAELDVACIEPNPHQPRSHFDEETLASLAASVRELGVLQPILVRPLDDGRYELIAGERRWRAARRAGLARIPAVIRTIDDSLSLEQAVVENLHRQDLNPLEEAGAYQQLIEDFGLTQDEVARRVGRSRSAVANILRLFQLPPAVQRLVRDGQLSAGHARALLGSPDRAFQEALARRSLERSLTVREVEEAVRARQGGAARPPTSSPAAGPGNTRPPGLLELEGLLSDRLDTRVSVSMGAKRGKVVIDFASVEDLERIYRLLTDPTIEA